MKIGIVCYPTFGGSGVVATELGLGMARRGHDVHFITYDKPVRLKHFEDNVYFHEVRPADYPLFDYAPYESSLASKIVDVARFENLDLLHVHYAIPHAAVAYLAKKILLQKNIYLPTITTLHGTDITLVGKDRSFKPIVEFGINKSDGVTTVSQSLKETTLSYFDITNDIKVIYNFVHFDRFRKIDKDHFKRALAPNGEKIITHTSNFRKVKRVDDVIRIFKRIQDKLPAKLLLVGDGPERAGLERLCREMGICSDVRFLGKQDAIEEILSISDLFLIPSGNESFGLAALEAMACEVPVISSNVGGLPELNIHGKTGFLSNVGDVEEMASNALLLLQDEHMHDSFSRNAYEHARQYDVSTIVTEYEAYYKEVYDRAVWKKQQAEKTI